MKKAVITICAVVAMLAVSGVAQGATLTAGSGGTYATFSAALTAASDGDRIEMMAGTYSSDMRYITKSVYVTHHSSATAGTVIFTNGGWSTQLQASDITLDGLTFGSAAAESVGRLRAMSSGGTIKNCTIQNTRDTSGHGVHIDGTNTTIDNNQFKNVAWEGIYMDGDGLTLSNNYIQASTIATTIAVRILSDSGTVIISDNEIDGSYYECLATWSSATITGNDFHDGYHGMQLRGSNTSFTVSGNNIHDNDLCGIDITDTVTSFNISCCNTITGNGAQGIAVGGTVLASGGSVNYNDIYGNGSFEIINYASSELDAENNWWGSAAGPAEEQGFWHEGTWYVTSPGDLSGPIDADPWLTSSCVPEPGTLSLLVIGGALAMVRRRRK